MTVYTTHQGLVGNMILSLWEDRSGTLWIGTDSGLACSRTKAFSSFKAVEGTANDVVTYLYQDRDSHLWISTWGNGLRRWQDGKLTTYTTRDGLFDDVIWTTLEDNNGNFWMTSNRAFQR